MALLKFPIAWFQIGSVLLAPPTKFHCQKPDLIENISNTEWESFYKIGLILDDNTTRTNTINSCLIPNTSYIVNGNNDSVLFENAPCPNGYTYNATIFKSTIISEWNLVCDQEYLVELSQIILMFGVLIGNIIFGIAADKYGRKISLMISIAIQAIAGLMTAIIPWFWGFVFFRFIVGLANGGTMITSFVLCMEIVGGKYRTIVPILYQIPFGLATSVMAVLSYWLSDWRQLQLTLSGISALFFSYCWLTTESPRWLLAIGKTERCRELLEKIAVLNKIETEKIRNYFKQLEKFKYEHESELGRLETIKNEAKLSDLFKSPKLARRTLLLYLNWFLSGISFFAFSLHVGHIGANGVNEDGAAGGGVRVAVAFAGLGAIPGALLCAWAARAAGRKWTVIIANVSAAGCLLVLASATPAGAPNWLRLVLVVINVIAMAVYTPALYVYTGELFPTVIRNAGVGVAAMFSRIGSMLAPLLLTSAMSTNLNVGKNSFMWGVSPVLISLSVLALIQALLVVPLPETRGKPLPDTIDDAENDSKMNNSNKYYTVPTTAVHLVMNSE